MSPRRSGGSRRSGPGLRKFSRFEPSHLPKGAAPKSVVVIGGGMAGLSAAFQLVRAGHAVTVLEARDAPGGRVRTLRTAFKEGQHAEAGAMFIQGHHSLVMGYIGLLGLPIVPIHEDLALMVAYLRGTRVVGVTRKGARWPVALTPAEKRAGYWGLWHKYLISILSEPAPHGVRDPLARYDHVSLGELLRSRGASPGAIEVMTLGYLDLFGEGIYNVSALAVLNDLASSIEAVPSRVQHGFNSARHVPPGLRKDFQVVGEGREPYSEAERQSYTIEGGNDRLPKALAATPELASRVVLNAVAERVESAGAGVRVLASVRGRRQAFDADHVICALPFSMLRTIDLAVPLSDEKRRAIRDLRNTSVVRHFVQTKRRVWNRGGGSGLAATDLQIMYVNDQTITQPGPYGIIESYSTGSRARQWAAMEAEARHHAVVAQLALIYPGIASQVVAHATMSWDDDPWARGDYVFYEPGEETRFHRVAARPEGRLSFAGDHVSTIPGWIEGALETAHAAASHVHRTG